MIYQDPKAHREGRLDVHLSQTPLHITPVSQPLYVITSIFNPNRYASRYKLFHGFEKHVTDSGAIPYTIEVALRDRHHEVTLPDNPRHIQLRTESEVWFKENSQNVALRYLPHDWEYVAFVDADFLFTRPDWAFETVQMLQHYDVVQMYTNITYLNNQHRVHNTLDGFVYTHLNQGQYPKSYGHRGAVGGAWAYRRSALEKLGGLLETCILGSADWHMAFQLALRDDVHPEMKFDKIPKYVQSIREWGERAKGLKGNIGYVDANCIHHWHGSLKNRAYDTRWKILVENGFNPYEDLSKDWQGLLKLTGNKPQMKHQIRQYFKQRNEDSVE